MNDFQRNFVYYTDGACKGNPGPGGWAAISLEHNAESNLFEGYALRDAHSEQEENTTNNRMEMKAMIYALKEAQKNPKDFFTIYSDSAYVVNMIHDWIYTWARNGWTRAKNKPIENLDLVKEIWDLINVEFSNFEVIKCGGHSGILGNELADAAATKNETKFEKLVQQYNVGRKI